MNCWKDIVSNQHLIHRNDVKFNDYLNMRVEYMYTQSVQHDETEEVE